MSERFTQAYAGMLLSGTPEIRATQAHVGLAGRSSPRRRVTQAYVSVLGNLPRGAPVDEHTRGLRFTQAYAQVMIPFTPNFAWIDMFVNEVFPYDISLNSLGATRFETDVVVVDSGYDQRTSRWDQPLMEYDVAYGVRTMEQLHGLLAFFRAMRGRKHAFLYHDHVDYTSTLATNVEARAAPQISPFDQVLGTGDHSTKTFHLLKRYPTPGGQAEHLRPVYKPRQGSVMLAVDGVPVDNWVCNHANGQITFVSDLVVEPPANLSIGPRAGFSGQWTVVGPAETFSGFVQGDKVIMSGWVHPANNTTEIQAAVVQSIAQDGAQLHLTLPPGQGAVETNVSGVRLTRHPAPRAGRTITAGFHFWVPVRFDTDRLSVSLEEYGIGGATDVRLIEVRPSEENL